MNVVACVQWQDRHVQRRILIKSQNYDVLVLAVHYFPSLDRVDEMWIQAGIFYAITDHRRYIPVHEICESMSPLDPKILPGHACPECM